MSGSLSSCLPVKCLFECLCALLCLCMSLFLLPWVSHSHYPSVCPRIYISCCSLTDVPMCAWKSLYIYLCLCCSHSKYYCFFYFCLSLRFSLFLYPVFLFPYYLYLSISFSTGLSVSHSGHCPLSFSPHPTNLPLFVIPSMSTLLSLSVHVLSVVSLHVCLSVCLTVSFSLSLSVSP